MAGDITRSTFQKRKHYSGVRMQQGRVSMDADWNEQVDIDEFRRRTADADIIGKTGVPSANGGFAVSVAAGNLQISKGRIYVDGGLCENEAAVMIAAPTPAGAVAGQPDLPGITYASGGSMALGALLTRLGGVTGFDLPSAAGYYAAYLDVWERDITSLDDPSIREIALGGPDTATRTKVVWQAKLLHLAGAATAPEPPCPTDFSTLLPPSTGQLMAQAQATPTTSDPCSIPAQAGYRRLENQLYRVEIHQAGKAATATFKWSRDNGSVIAAWTGVDPANASNLFVSTLGKDQVLGFSGGQWVELTDDTRELWGLPGTIVQLTSAQVQSQGPTLTINAATASGSVALADFPLNPKVRRWDFPSSQPGAAPVQEGAWLNLESGVQVWFNPGGAYRTGDYWLIPARTATAISSPQVQWQVDNSGKPILQNSLLSHSYCGLAVLAFDPTAGWSAECDCRPVFSPLAHPGCLHVTDVRTVNPDATLPNDSLVDFATLAGGLKLVCDGAVDPASIKLPTCFVTIDFAVSGSPPANGPVVEAAILPITLLASVTASGNTIFWFPFQEAVSYITEQLATVATQTDNRAKVVVRVTLKGNSIWSLGCASITLDGETFTNPQRDASGNLYSALKLPSGDGRPGGDFVSWVWVPGYCDKTFPAFFQPFQQITSIAGPDASGDHVVVGMMSPANYAVIQKLALPDVSARKIYCSPVQMGPGTVAYAYVATAAERQGNFSNFSMPVIDPASNQQFPGNIIPASRLPAASTATGAGPGVYAWRVRSIVPPYGYYGYGAFYGIGAELI